ncbi:E3 SUMO-protein ligase PIAS2-like isoform X4 [Biomphalaria pfeifferi]|uniref:E3 SUMO-protein ligase PIAS2-like isoform X4 n=1 Tax=Biomphalaria pfeifferi TaxID=112525 RepID=A0AAD8BG13_BIOPF|nr:E3 SUMO-protein ligase PIAS2-like isoform X4 [Biomphalaria pfeifferi]
MGRHRYNRRLRFSERYRPTFRTSFIFNTWQTYTFTPIPAAPEAPAVRCNADRSFEILKNSAVKLSVTTQEMIREKFAESAEDDLSVTTLSVSMICPIGKSRMVTPTRGKDCRHLQCFDGLTYLKLNDCSRPRWKCPVCDSYCPENELVIDPYFTELILKAPSSTEIIIHKDGSWSAQESVAQQNKNVITALEPPSSETDSSAIRPISLPIEQVQCFSAQNPNIIDLTISEQSNCIVVESEKPKANFSLLLSLSSVDTLSKKSSTQEPIFIDLTLDSYDNENVSLLKSWSGKTSNANIITETISVAEATTLALAVPGTEAHENLANFQTGSNESPSVFRTVSSPNVCLDTINKRQMPPRKPRFLPQLFRRRSVPHPMEIEAKGLQEMTDFDFSNFLIDNGIVWTGKKMIVVG